MRNLFLEESPAYDPGDQTSMTSNLNESLPSSDTTAIGFNNAFNTVYSPLTPPTFSSITNAESSTIFCCGSHDMNTFSVGCKNFS